MYYRKIELTNSQKNSKEVKTKKYVWECVEELPKDPVTGKRKRITARGKTKPEAKAKLEKKLKEATSYGLLDNPNQSKITFEELANEWLKIQKNHTKESAYRSSCYHVKRFGKYISKIQVRLITKKLYQNVLDQMRDDGYSYNTIYSAHTVARKIFKQAKAWDIIDESPSDYAILPKKKVTVEELEKDEIRESYLEKDELRLFLKYTQTRGLEFDVIVFHLLAFTGMRIGELLALKWSDIDFEKKEINIIKTLYNIDGPKEIYKLLPPKTDSSIRKITFDENTEKLLRGHRSEQNRLKMIHRKMWDDKNFIISRSDGTPLSPRFVYYRMKRLENILRKETNFNKHLHPHILRHTHTSLLTEAGANLGAIMQRLGHADAKTTLAVYTHITKNLKQETADKLGSMIKNLGI